jgi:hypothetical protein
VKFYTGVVGQVFAYLLLTFAIGFAIYKHVSANDKVEKKLRAINVVQTQEIEINQNAIKHLCTTTEGLLAVDTIVADNLRFFIIDARRQLNGNPDHDDPLIAGIIVFTRRLQFVEDQIKIIKNDAACRLVTVPKLENHS